MIEPPSIRHWKVELTSVEENVKVGVLSAGVGRTRIEDRVGRRRVDLEGPLRRRRIGLAVGRGAHLERMRAIGHGHRMRRAARCERGGIDATLEAGTELIDEKAKVGVSSVVKPIGPESSSSAAGQGRIDGEGQRGRRRVGVARDVGSPYLEGVRPIREWRAGVTPDAGEPGATVHPAFERHVHLLRRVEVEARRRIVGRAERRVQNLGVRRTAVGSERGGRR